jgi:hypothetical protein
VNYGGKINTEAQKCIDACIDAYSCCEQTVAHCLKQGDQYADMMMVGPLMDCVDVARACADMTMRQSPHATEMAATCARVAEMCAEACMTMNSDSVMKRCGGICRTCAEACRSVAGVRA